MVSRKGGDAAVASAGAAPERRRRVKLVAWSSVWLLVLGAPASEIWGGSDQPQLVAGGLLAAFVGLYLTLLWLQSDPSRSSAVKVALVAPLAAISLAGSLTFHQSWPFLFFFLSVAVACALPANRAVFGIGAVTVLDAIVVTRPSLDQTKVGPQIFGVFMAGIVVMFITRLLRLIADLNTAREELARLAVADERLRFARDLHDLLGHTLSLIVVKSEAVRRLVHQDADAAARESGDIELVSRQALAEVREAVTNYRERSLEAELEGARVALSAAGIEATIYQPGARLPDTVESVLGWTVREGVTNVVRHSNGRHCAIDLRQTDGAAVLEICDDGYPVTSPAVTEEADASGPDRRRVGTGLRGLAERLAAAHGRLEAGRRPDGGFRLAVTVPLQQDETV
jgi:two-component system sensor histidine kinase DesK